VAAAPGAPPYGPKATRLNTPLPWTQPEGSVPSSAAAKRTRWTVARASALMERRCSAHSSVLLDGERADEADDGSSIREDPTTSVRRRSPLLRPTGPQKSTLNMRPDVLTLPLAVSLGTDHLERVVLPSLAEAARMCRRVVTSSSRNSAGVR
jgi:hypothetical protein